VLHHIPQAAETRYTIGEWYDGFALIDETGAEPQVVCIRPSLPELVLALPDELDVQEGDGD
jgi:hypothetical protein